MISSDMYKLLSNTPHCPNEGTYSDILEKSGLDERTFNSLVSEAKYDGYEYIYAPVMIERYSVISLTEKGKALVEEYENNQRNEKTVDRSLKITKIAMWAAIANAIAAIASLIKMCI